MRGKERYTAVRRRWLLCFFILIAALLMKTTVLAEEEKTPSEISKEAEESLFEELDTDEIDKVLSSIYPGKRVRFQDVVTALMDEEETISPKLLSDFVLDVLFGLIRDNRPAMMKILLLVIVSSVFTNFSSVFQSRQIADCAFYIVYTLLITICLAGFSAMTDTVEEGLESLLLFMKVLSPTYFLCMAVAKGSISSLAFYQLILILIYLVELLVVRFVIPLVRVYLMVQILNFLSGEEYLSKTGELLETVISWVMKLMLTLVTGVGVIQGILSPAVDQVKRNTLTKGAQMIPGIGDALGGMTEIVLGTAVLIKNAVGMAGALLAVGICIFPILNMAVVTLMYKLIAALIQPISDRRIVEAVASVGNACQMLMKVVFTTAVLFLIMIAVAAVSTG